MLVYMRTLPSYDTTDKKKDEERIDADDPKNKDKIEHLLFG